MEYRIRTTQLVLFFTKGVSLVDWDKGGILTRETALYNRLGEHGVRVSFVTYGDSRDMSYFDRLKGITVCCNRWHLPQRWYERLVPWLHGSLLRGADLIKSNQTAGAEVALTAAWRWGKPFVARGGYLWSDFVCRDQGAHSITAKQSLELEERIFKRADRVVVTTFAMADELKRRLPDVTERLRLIPNYVDTVKFAPETRQPEYKTKRLCYVGRLVSQKNLPALISAVTDMDVDLELIGDGPLRTELEQQAKENPRVRFFGTIPNNLLPEHLRSATAFVLPSLYEGHPKALLEAMSCGLPVIATDVPGNREVIRHGETGWLCGTDELSLRQAIIRVLEDNDLQEQLGIAARQEILAQFSLDRVALLELSLYRELLDKDGECF